MEVGPLKTVGSTGSPLQLSETPSLAQKRGLDAVLANIVNCRHLTSCNKVMQLGMAKTGKEKSGPPSPREGPITNFGHVDNDLYRSGFPSALNIQHLESLKLKTIVTFLTTEFDPQLTKWMSDSGIQHYRIEVGTHKASTDTIPNETIVQVMNLLLDEAMRPMLIHCNKGKHRTGCMTACYRKMKGMDTYAALTEYHKYAGAKARVYDNAFITHVKPYEVVCKLSVAARPAELVCYSRLSPAASIAGRAQTAEGDSTTEHARPNEALASAHMPPTPFYMSANELNDANILSLTNALVDLELVQRHGLPTPPTSSEDTPSERSESSSRVSCCWSWRRPSE